MQFVQSYVNTENGDENSSDPTGQDYIPYWYFAGGAVVLYVVYFIHLYLNRTFTQFLVSLSTKLKHFIVIINRERERERESKCNVHGLTQSKFLQWPVQAS